MIELHPSEFASVLPLLASIKQKVLPKAICQGYSPGRIFVDWRDHPQMVMVWSTLGYYFIAGVPHRPHDWVEASRVLAQIFVPASQAGGESSFILVPAQEGWNFQLFIKRGIANDIIVRTARSGRRLGRIEIELTRLVIAG